jgi:hypothetical protein
MVLKMMTIYQDMDYAGADAPVKRLVEALKDYHEYSPFATGIDRVWQLYWATMSDEQALVFIMKHPEYEHRFTKIGE